MNFKIGDHVRIKNKATTWHRYYKENPGTIKKIIDLNMYSISWEILGCEIAVFEDDLLMFKEKHHPHTNIFK